MVTKRTGKPPGRRAELRTFRYSPSDRKQIVASLPRMADRRRVIMVLEAAASTFLSLELARSRRDPKGSRKSLAAIAKKLDDACRSFEAISPDAARWRGIPAMAAAVKTIRDQIMANRDAEDGMVASHSGRKNLFRTGLYGDVIDAWVEAGGAIKWSRPSLGGEPSGPLIRYIRATLAPVLVDKVPGVERIVQILRDRKKRPGFNK